MATANLCSCYSNILKFDKTEFYHSVHKQLPLETMKCYHLDIIHDLWLKGVQCLV